MATRGLNSKASNTLLSCEPQKLVVIDDMVVAVVPIMIVMIMLIIVIRAITMKMMITNEDQ